MGGGSSGSGGITDARMAELAAAATKRLQELISTSSHLLFACEPADRKSLDARLKKSTTLQKKKYSIVENVTEAEPALKKSTFTVVYTEATTTTKFLDWVVDQTIVAKKAGVHVKGKNDALVPSKVSAMRWHSIGWNELESFFS